METTQKTWLLPKMLKQEGLSWPVAAFFIAGEIIGAGLLAIPFSISNTSYVGFSMLAVLFVIFVTSGILVGKCWNILQERYEEYREQPTRDPFPSIGFRAYGNPGRYTVSIVNSIAMFGISVVIMLFSSKIVQSLLIHLHLDVSFCVWLLVVAGAVLPLSFLGTPSDFTPAAVIACLTSVLASVMLTVNILQMEPEPILNKVTRRPTFKVQPYFAAFGLMTYSFSGNFTFPTIQHDMKEPRKFNWSVVLAFIMMYAICLPVSISAFVILGDNISENILDDVDKYRPGPMLYVVEVLMIVHYIMAILITLNPLFQQVEDLLQAPHKFHWKRVVIRTLILVAIVFVAESIPRFELLTVANKGRTTYIICFSFSAVMSLLGASAVSIQIFIFPPLFYWRLKSIGYKQDGKHSEVVPRLTRIFLVLIMVIGVVCGCCATYNAIATIVEPNSFVLPCYLRSFNTTK